MPMKTTFTISFALLLCFILPLSISAADKNKKAAASDGDKPSYEQPQPAKENLDYTMYQRIRDEGIAHSHVMEFASALVDGIGPRLTGSPNREQGQRVDSRPTDGDGVQQRASRRLGRVWHGLAAAQYVGDG